jgi:membrane protease subunit HflK
MPWQNQGGGGGPWGGRPGGGKPPPDIEEMLRRSQDKVRRFLPSGGSGKGLILIAAIVVLVWLATGFYRVDTNQQGVALIFGKLWAQTLPGLHYNLPAPIGEVITPEVTRVNRVEVGFRGGTAGRRSSVTRNVIQESLMLTGDENIIDIQFVVFWKIKNAANFLFKVRNPELTVKAAAEAAMRETIGKDEFETARTTGRGKITGSTKVLIQRILDDYGAGITITTVEIQKVDPPEAVIDAFRDVQAARADKERAVNEATAYRNEVVQRALGQAAQVVASAEAYKQEKIRKAEGESQRFLSVYEEYIKDKDVTKRRMYLETMEDVLQGMDKVLLQDSSAVPYLPLDQLTKPRDKSSAEKGAAK